MMRAFDFADRGLDADRATLAFETLSPLLLGRTEGPEDAPFIYERSPAAVLCWCWPDLGGRTEGGDKQGASGIFRQGTGMSAKTALAEILSN